VEKRYVPLAVLISGRGSNLQAIIDAIGAGVLPARIAVVISNVAEAGGLRLAREAGLETAVVDHRAFSSRDAFDRALVAEIRARGAELVCLAGFMRRLGPAFCDAFPNAILNIHPSLLPAFSGLDAQRQAVDHGVRVSGATVHFVTGDLDAGPIIAQAAVDCSSRDSPDTLAARILDVEHRLYPHAIGRILDGRWRVAGRRVIFEND
jgi:phosphoribosylglycinamide formyltransferase-1